MRIKQEELFAGGYYHLFNHAAGDNCLFGDTDDYVRCLTTIKRYLQTHPFDVIAYCLMPNHYHFLLRQTCDTPLIQPVNLIWASYSRYYNKKYHSWGSIFRGRLQHHAIIDSRTLLQICVYIHRNPLEAGLVVDLKGWQWSNYWEWIGLRNGQLFCCDVRDMFFVNGAAYAEFMRDYRET